MHEQEIEVGVVTEFFAQAGVAAVRLSSDVRIGDALRFKGHSTDTIQDLSSIHIDGRPVRAAKSGDEIGIKVMERVRPRDKVYKVLVED
jgi:U32 family peptidase